MENWLFAYGSLMWNPGFAVAERAVARLSGFQRSFCLWSTHYRGTPEAPGLVLGLDPAPGAQCRGVALRVDPSDWPEVLAEVRARELVTNAYRETTLELELDDGRRVQAISYVIRPEHPQYAGALAPGEQARIIARAAGQRGPNAEYLFNTALHLAEMGLPDAEMEALVAEVRSQTAPV